MELDSSTEIMTFKGDLFKNLDLLKEFNIVIITTLIQMSQAEKINEFCRKKNKGFIYACQIGIMSFLFEDFGNNFIVYDKTGKKCKKYFIKSITNACPGIVEISPIEIIEEGKKRKKYLELETGDYVIFKEVSGMVELNDTPPRPIRVLSKNKFTIEETTRYDEFTGLGTVEEIKIPFPVKFLPLSQALKCIYFEENQKNDIIGNDKIVDEKIFDIDYEEMIDNEIKKQFDDNLSWMNIFNVSDRNESLMSNSNPQMHLALLVIHNYYSIYNSLPKYIEQQNNKVCLEISSRIFNMAKEKKEEWTKDINEIDNQLLSNIFKYCEFSFIPYIQFFGGIVTQETLKYIGLYKPAGQWVYFNLMELMNNKIPFIGNEQILNDIGAKQNLEQFMIYNKEKLKLLNNSKIVIIGFNDVGFELLNLFISLNLGKNLTILDKNKNQNYSNICKLKSLNNFQIITESTLENDISEKEWWKNSKIIIDALSYKYNKKEKQLLIINSKKQNKILITVNSNKSIGSFELVLPIGLEKKRNIYNPVDEIITPNGNNIKQNSLFNYQEEAKYINIINLKQSLNYIENIFENYFNISIKYLNELIKRKESEQDISKYIDDLILKENNNGKILKLIRHLKKLVSIKAGIVSFDSIVLIACEIFQEFFQFPIDEIFFKYPEDFIELGKHKKFWTGKRHPPKAIILDINNEDHFQVLSLIVCFFCHILEYKDFEKKKKDIKSIAKKYEMKKYDSSILTKNESVFNREKNSLIRFLTMMEKNIKFEFKGIKLDINNNEDINDLEKLNNHTKFIILASKLILKSYGIKSYNNIYQDISLLLNIDNILPSTASSISGLIFIQILLMFNEPDFIEFFSSFEENKNEIQENIIIENKNNIEEDFCIFQNACFNLALNTYLFYNSIKIK